MSDEQQINILDQIIKGFNLRILIGFSTFLISGTIFCYGFYTEQKEQGKQLDKISQTVALIKNAVDTAKVERKDMGRDIKDLQEDVNDLQNVTSIKTALYTQRWVNGKLVFIKVK